MFVLDYSASIRSHRFDLVRNFVERVSSRLNIALNRSLVGVISFNEEARTVFDLTEYSNRSSLLARISQLTYDKTRRTHTHLGLEHLLSTARDGSLGIRNGRPHVAIVVTDGKSRYENLTSAAAMDLRNSGIFQVYAAGVAGADEDELRIIASDPSLAFFTNNFDLVAITELEKRISTQLCMNQSKNSVNQSKNSVNQCTQAKQFKFISKEYGFRLKRISGADPGGRGGWGG